MSKIAPIEGWMLDAIVEYDETHNGFAGHYLRASAERRQVVAALFSTGSHNDSGKSRGGRSLVGIKHNTILSEAFDQVPRGFRRALAKSGTQPHDQNYYADLCGVLNTGHQWMIDAVMHSKALGPERLTIIKALPADLCDSRIVDRIESIKNANDLIIAVDLIEAKTGKRQPLVDALLASKNSLESVVRRWCRKIEYTDHPIQRGDGYRPIRNGIELHEVARRYQNCSRNYTVSTITGDNAFGEYIVGDVGVLLCFEKSKGSWALEGVYGRRNRSIADSIERQARSFAEQHGIFCRWGGRSNDDDIGQALRRIIRPYSDW